MKKRLLIVLVIIVLLMVLPGSALAQAYSYQVPKMTANVFWNEDGSIALDYVIVFHNEPSAHPIDYVDLGLPNSSYNDSDITADANGVLLSDISTSGFQGTGTGVAIGMGSQTISAGGIGTLHVTISKIERVLRPDSQDSGYASAVFAPAQFENVRGYTDLTVTFHFPPGLQPQEPRWHTSQPGWGDPVTAVDDQGRATYTWHNTGVGINQEIDFGASFPSKLVPSQAIVRPSFWETLGINPNDLFGYTFCCGLGLFFVFITFISIRSGQRRKLQYLPPKISIEGHGIKRGLTAVEAAILLEQPMDKIMTMILFSVVKKGAATVTSNDPLKVQATQPQPQGLYPYETKFLEAMGEGSLAAQRRTLQAMMIDLVKSVAEKMKGFSRKETVDFYRSIVDNAWAQVEAADTPEVKSQKFDENIDWTMMDRNYDERTRRVFTGGPVFVPIWWPRFDPTYSTPHVGPTSTTPIPSSKGGGGMSLPTLPGATFAANMVHGVQNFSSNVIGNVTEFTSGVTNKTNPIPVATQTGSRGGFSGGGHSCACACACAGCACACAGGGR